jgi:hypothetical protein
LWRAFAIGVICLGLCSCVQSSAVTCGDHVCPPGSTCSTTDECIPSTCRDGKLQATEQCDGTVVGDCTDHGYYLPDGLACSETCTADVSQCEQRCGDHEPNGPETCDGLPPEGQSCTDFGRDLGPIGCAAGCAPDLRDCGTLGWQQAPGDASAKLDALWGTDLGHVWAVGVGGAIVQRREDGVWTPMISNTTAALQSVWGTSSDHVLAVGSGGTLDVFDGTTWTPQIIAGGTDLTDIDGTATETVAVGFNGTIVELVGGSWVSATLSPPTSAAFSSVYAGAMVAVGAGGVVYQRVGGIWSPMAGVPSTSSLLYAVSGSGSTIVITGASGLVLYFDGTTWTQLTAPVLPPLIVPPELTSIWMDRRGEAYIGGSAGFVYRFDGQRLVNISTGATRTALGLFGLDRHHLIAAIGSNLYENAGTVRRAQLIDKGSLPGTLSSIARTGTDLIAGTYGGLVFRRSDGNTWGIYSGSITNGSAIAAIWSSGTHLAFAGDTIYYSSNGLTGPINQVAGLTGVKALSGVPGDLYAAGDSGIRHTTDLTGSVWVTEHTGGPPLAGIWAGSGGTAIAVGQQGTILRRSSSGQWTSEVSGVTNDLYAVWGSDAQHIYAVGLMGVVVRYDGTAWRRIPLPTGEPLRAVGGTDRSNVWIVGFAGTIFRFDGTSWSRVTSTTSFALLSVLVATDEVDIAADFGTATEILRTCSDTELRCGDAWDDDCDGMLNCADPDCNSVDVCQQGGVCGPARPLACNARIDDSTFTGVARIDDLDCIDHATRGTETTYRFTAEASGPMTITLDDPSGLLALAIAPATHDACDLSRCSASTAVEGGREATFTATAGDTYYVIVDGPLGAGVAFQLERACP